MLKQIITHMVWRHCKPRIASREGPEFRWIVCKSLLQTVLFPQWKNRIHRQAFCIQSFGYLLVAYNHHIIVCTWCLAMVFRLPEESVCKRAHGIDFFSLGMTIFVCLLNNYLVILHQSSFKHPAVLYRHFAVQFLSSSIHPFYMYEEVSSKKQKKKNGLRVFIAGLR